MGLKGEEKPRGESCNSAERSAVAEGYIRSWMAGSQLPKALIVITFL